MALFPAAETISMGLRLLLQVWHLPTTPEVHYPPHAGKRGRNQSSITVAAARRQLRSGVDAGANPK